MVRRRKPHRHDFPELLYAYAKSRGLDVKTFPNGQYRIHDNGYVAVDVWLTGSYNIGWAYYDDIARIQIWRPQRSHGKLPKGRRECGQFLDTIFFAWAKDKSTWN